MIGLLVRAVVAFGAVLLPAARQAPPGVPPTQPILRIEADGHSVGPKGIAVDPAGHFLVTCSDDKTARVWELPSLRLTRTLRVPIGITANEGKLFALALSPDGSTVAVGGWTGYEWNKANCIYLFNVTSGQIVRRIGGFPSVVNSLGYSPDGHSLAAGLGLTGVRVFDPATGTERWRDEAFKDSIYGLSYDQRGRLAVCSNDGSVRLYGAGGEHIAAITRLKGEVPWSVSFAPDGNTLALSCENLPMVAVLRAADLSESSKLDTSGLTGMNGGAVYSVAWSSDGESLYAAGYGSADDKGQVLRRWDLGAAGAWSTPHDIAISHNGVLALATLPNSSGVAFAAGDGLGTVGQDGTVSRIDLNVADPRGLGDKFLVDSSGETVRFAFKPSAASPASFSVAGRSLDASPTDQSGLGAAPKTGGIPVTDWEDSLARLLHGKPIPLRENELSRSLAVAPGGSQFLLGASFYIRCFDSEGKQRWQQQAPGEAWAVNVSGNGKLAIAALGDGTIRWYRMSDGQPLLSLFASPDGHRWVMWTPTGYYDCSPDGESLIGWNVNRAADQAPDFFPASSFRDTYYRPDIVGRVLKTLDEPAAIQEANAAAARPTAAPIAAALPPVVRILERRQAAGSDDALIRYSVRTPTGVPVKGVMFLVDGRPAKTDSGLSVVSKESETTLESHVSASENARVTVIAFDAQGRVSEPAATEMTARSSNASPPPDLTPKPKGRLLALVVGIAAYGADAGVRNLAYCEADASAVAQALQGQEGKLYTKVVVHSLLGPAATKDGILQEGDWLEHEEKDHPEDTTVVYLAGHGGTDDRGNYLFLPYSYRSGFRSTAVTGADLFTLVQSLGRGHAIICLDACHSGCALGGLSDVNGIVNSLASPQCGGVVLTACTGSQIAYEGRSFDGHGAFTKALLDCLSGKEGKPILTIRELSNYIYDKVKEMTSGLQTPAMTPGTIDDFPIAVFSQ